MGKNCFITNGRCKISNTKIIATVNDGEIPNFSINGSTILFDGWMKIDRDGGEKQMNCRMFQ